MRIPLLAVFMVVSAEALCAPTRVYEGTKTILTGPYDEKVAPRSRPDAFSAVEHAAVYLENDYLRCCLLPRAGGRIYEVYHKPTKSQVFHVNRYLETHSGDELTSHEWDLGGLEINFPHPGHGNTYNDVWQWAPVRGGKEFAGVVMASTSRRTMQRIVFRVLLRSDSARLDLTYRFENLSPFPWGLAGWINAAPAGSASARWLLPPGWVMRHPPDRDPERRFWSGPSDGSPLETLTLLHGPSLPGRSTFAGVHDAARASGLVRIYDPGTLPVVKLAALSTGRFELRARVYSESSTLTDGLWRQPELSAHEASESWYPIRGLEGCVLANEDLALRLDRPARRGRIGRNVEIGICASRRRENCVVSLASEHETIYRTTFDLDPAKPWRKIVPARPGPVLLEVQAPDGRRLARYEMREEQRESPPALRADRAPAERGTDPVEEARHGELLEALERRPRHFLGDSISTYAALLRRSPGSEGLKVDLARAYLRDAQLRAGAGEADSGRSISNFHKAHDLLEEVVKRNRKNSRARFYLGLALEGLEKPAHAAGEYRAALKGVLAAPASGLYLAHTVIRKSAKDALEAARAVASAYPESRRARHMLMVALTADRKAKEAVALGRELYSLDPADPITTQLLSESLRAAKEPGEATRFEEETARLIVGDEAAERGLEQDLRWLHGLDVRLDRDS